MADQDVGNIDRDYDLHRIVEIHHHRHALRKAVLRGHVAGAAVPHVGPVRLVDRLVFRCQRGLSRRGPIWHADALPLPFQVWIFGLVECLSAC